MTLADWLRQAAAALYPAALPPALVDALTPSTLAAWLADRPALWTSPAADGSPATRSRAVAAAVTRATLAAARNPRDLADQFPAPDAPDPPQLFAAVMPLVDPDAGPPATVGALTWLHALWQWARTYDADLRHPLAPVLAAWLDAHRPDARPDRWQRATMPRLVTSETADAPARSNYPTMRRTGPPWLDRPRSPDLDRWTCPPPRPWPISPDSRRPTRRRAA